LIVFRIASAASEQYVRFAGKKTESSDRLRGNKSLSKSANSNKIEILTNSGRNISLPKSANSNKRIKKINQPKLLVFFDEEKHNLSSVDQLTAVCLYCQKRDFLSTNVGGKDFEKTEEYSE
jgi:hypothetical protein